MNQVKQQVEKKEGEEWVEIKLMVAEEDVSPEVKDISREIEACRGEVYGKYIVNISRKGDLNVTKDFHAVRNQPYERDRGRGE